jgi:hypothetical protein
MTNRKEKPRYDAGRRIRWLGVAIVLAAVAYSAGWYWLAGRVDMQATRLVEAQRGQGLAIDCADRDIRGYPFRLEIFCTSFAMARPAGGLTVQAGAFRSAAQVYEPRRVYAELDAPVTVDSPLIGRVKADWTLGRATATLADPLPERVSLSVDDLGMAIAGIETALSAAHAEAHMRRLGGELDLALRYQGLVVDPRLVAGRTLPVLSGDADIRLENGVALASEGVSSLRGVSGEIHRLALLLTPERGFWSADPSRSARTGSSMPG